MLQIPHDYVTATFGRLLPIEIFPIFPFIACSVDIDFMSELGDSRRLTTIDIIHVEDGFGRVVSVSDS